MDTLAILRRAWSAGLVVRPTPDGRLAVSPRERLTDELRELLRAHREELLEALARGCPACNGPVDAGHPCPECGGHAGHTTACSAGPGPASAPSPADVLALAAMLEWPELVVAGRYIVAGRRAAWEAFCRVPTPERLAIAFEALEDFEARWRAEAPTAEEVAP